VQQDGRAADEVVTVVEHHRRPEPQVEVELAGPPGVVADQQPVQLGLPVTDPDLAGQPHALLGVRLGHPLGEVDQPDQRPVAAPLTAGGTVVEISTDRHQICE
jgi:phage tail protein X